MLSTPRRTVATAMPARQAFAPPLRSSAPRTATQKHRRTVAQTEQKAHNQAVSAGQSGVTKDAWGNILSVSDSVPGGWMYRYMGMWGCRLDADTGLVYCQARWLDPTIQRFISRDILRSQNRYNYAANNPASLIDPLGEAPTVSTEEMARRQRVGRQFADEVLRILNVFGIRGRAERRFQNATTGDVIRVDLAIDDMAPYDRFALEIKVSAKPGTYREGIRQVAGRYPKVAPGQWRACRHQVQMLSPALEENSPELMSAARRFAGRYLTRYRFWGMTLVAGGLVLSVTRVASADPAHQGEVAVDEGTDWAVAIGVMAALTRVLGSAGAGFVVGAANWTSVYSSNIQTIVTDPSFPPDSVFQMIKHRR